MIKFVNAKLNIGLNIVRRYPNGFHELKTIFYPVGLYNGTPQNPEPFGDILEVTPSETGEDAFTFSGREVSCRPEDNLVVRSLDGFSGLYQEVTGKRLPKFNIHLNKALPEKAGLGGGSADASFLLMALNELTGGEVTDAMLAEAALKLGSDCPFFILNKPCFAGGRGEQLVPLEEFLKGKWCVISKPDIDISTKEAFAMCTPHVPDTQLPELVKRPIEEWQSTVVNDFEATLFPKYPELQRLRDAHLEQGAKYSAMSGSGSSIYGIYDDRETALRAYRYFSTQCYAAVCLL